MARTPHLLHLFSTFAAGGPQVRTAQLINAFSGRYRHTIVALDGCTECRSRIDSSVDVRFEAAPRKSRSLTGPWRMARLIRRALPDLVLTYNWGAIEGVLGARLAGVRRIVHAEDGFGPDEADRQKRRRILARRLVLRLCSRVVVPSLRLEDLALRVWKLPRKKVCYLPNGIDPERFHPGRDDALRQRFEIPPDAFVIGTVARLRPEKGLDLLIEAFAQLPAGLRPDCWLMIVGDGPEIERLRALARARRIEGRVRFTGNLDDAAAAYRAFDLFALTSRTEQMPLTVAEAMASGLAVVATDVGDVRAMLSEENQRWIATSRAPAGFALQLEDAVAHRADREKTAGMNRERCLSRFALEPMIVQYGRLYEEALRG